MCVPAYNFIYEVIDLIEKNYGEWTVLGLDEEKSKGHKKYYHCICSCGTQRSVVRHSLKSGDSTNCGCVRKGLNPNKQSHNKTHGMYGTRFYNIYRQMVDRCTKPNHNRYSNYGGKGIRVEWEHFEQFKEDMYDSYLEHVAMYGEKDTTIERIDVDKNYTKSNCTWATRIEQMNNTSRNVFYDYKGKSLTLAEICRIEGLPYKTVHKRLKDGKTLEDALSIPIRQIKKTKVLA